MNGKERTTKQINYLETRDFLDAGGSAATVVVALDVFFFGFLALTGTRVIIFLTILAGAATVSLFVDERMISKT